MTLPEGKCRRLYLVGNYRFNGKLLGKGNFARVEEALHTILNVRVAVKIMDLNQIKEDYVIKNLYREAKLMAKLNHPCICALYQTMQRTDNIYYLVTELASGGDLCTFVKEQRDGRLEERPARIYARQFVSALAHMHAIGVVHRDLKMENVMLNSARTQIKIVDFGLSNLYDQKQPLKTHCGSPEYAAPELFVTGMTYGPEVDLWSLGIILYGMVVGQLPFVSNRDEQITSQERRKKLVAQINKGLSGSHRKALALFSSDFRHMVCRMLVADVQKRIGIKDLLKHPFITERGTKAIRIHPVKKLDVRHQAGIIAEICEIIRQSSDEVIKTINHEPYSKVGGMYNILAHKLALGRMPGDGVTKVLPAAEVEKGHHTANELSTKRSYNLRSLASSRGDHTPKIMLQEKKSSLPPTPVFSRPKTECKRPCTPSVGTRPCAVQPKPPEKKHLNYRDMKSSLMIRKAYSAGITPKTNRPSTVGSPVGAKSSGARKEQLNDAGEKRKEIASKKASLVLPNGLKINIKLDEKDVSAKLQTGVVERKTHSKSEKLPPATVKKGLGMTQSDSKATTGRPQTTPSKECRPFARLLKMARPSTSGQPLEKSAMAYGDIAQRKQQLVQKTKKPTIYDPIARSIAGYVCNNVPVKLSHIKK